MPEVKYYKFNFSDFDMKTEIFCRHLVYPILRVGLEDDKFTIYFCFLLISNLHYVTPWSRVHFEKITVV